MDIVMKRDAHGRERPQERDFDEAKRVVRVVPTNENLRKYLKHPTRGGFLAEGSAEWPNDQFTRRRIKEGDITIEETAQGEQRTIEASGAKSARSRAARSEVDPNKTTDPNKTA
jgi:hypothetical protein